MRRSTCGSDAKRNASSWNPPARHWISHSRRPTMSHKKLKFVPDCHINMCQNSCTRSFQKKTFLLFGSHKELLYGWLWGAYFFFYLHGWETGVTSHRCPWTFSSPSRNMYTAVAEMESGRRRAQWARRRLEVTEREGDRCSETRAVFRLSVVPGVPTRMGTKHTSLRICIICRPTRATDNAAMVRGASTLGWRLQVLWLVKANNVRLWAWKGKHHGAIGRWPTMQHWPGMPFLPFPK